MMRTLLGCACAVAMTHAVRAEECARPLERFAADVKAAAESTGGAEVTLQGGEAKRFLAYLNTKIGEPTDYQGDAVVIRLIPGDASTGRAMLVAATNGCMHEPALVLSPAAFMLAYKAARGDGV